MLKVRILLIITFTFDIITLLTKNINPVSLERKVTDPKNRDIIYMFWNECIEK